ncbi:hypothetical protein [Glycomyces paridis]|uniref:Uncharacterized protein n=1 Tax=Glycomyces paridis TaxID=2126555 RepID=A0A4S8PEY0_9ACTN|nr:hypothetical protein [Glycomyces paridis]THV28988.1 hypothetical protein E9998_09555 [Glycomyces paridis]
MSQSSTDITFALTDTAGKQYDTIIPGGLAELGPNGLLLSFVVLSPDNLFGETFVLRERSSRPEDVARKIAAMAGPSLLTLLECQVYTKATDEKVHPIMRLALNDLNAPLVRWAVENLPRLSKDQLGYYDVKGRLRFKELIYVS